MLCISRHTDQISAFKHLYARRKLTPSCRSVIYKLMSATFAMITLPLGTYFFTVNFVFNGT